MQVKEARVTKGVKHTTVSDMADWDDKYEEEYRVTD